ncbi:AraC family transcriptional regulator [Chitinophaga nivalis]|uniref:Helix-turn-helix domain-containing protein n=1 Tax=Chitinophaga nivalis TaxID=2991709 RepID=A0ABT3IJC4_9BACT|nr:helix-turn-helix domain-containing protein [Chitinophaga nivalis]MCW3466229.1 helix-turn-helix domain-containing protein [Chitinophaga nivalis]MCW3484080.1 helix-turn-helix domain-containing protein [Chitinophaga nivalis]
MPRVPDIRPIFKPIQPTVKHTAGQATYTELLPAMPLAPYIYCYWQLTADPTLQQPYDYQVVADGCMDIFFDRSDPTALYIMGFSSACTTFRLTHAFDYVGIRFLPAAFPLLFKVSAGELTNRFEALDQVHPLLAKGLCQLTGHTAPLATLTASFDQYFGQLLAHTPLQPDYRLFNAIDLMLTAPANLPIEQGLDTGISPRQLRRLFDFYIGDTPKAFSKVVRFQKALRDSSLINSTTRHNFFYDAGYYDQAHFIKEFKRMYGRTPALALK